MANDLLISKDGKHHHRGYRGKECLHEDVMYRIVSTAVNWSISKLKDAIKEKKQNDFDNVDADKLKLWKVDISLEEENKKLELVNTKITVNIKEDLGGEELPLLSKLSKYFPSQPADEHIHIIIQRPRKKFTAPQRDEHIVINREYGGNEKEIICLVDDEDLAAQQPFSLWTFPQIKTLFGLSDDSYGELADTANYEKILEARFGRYSYEA
ncbi:hypothetical protein RhiirA4_550826 [Rhizophagus irregularis]|uniref:Crinkler effector protein N-terminal domain-containing protein n=1 Tax=Rhizophagus irregularis TaxID=588596 RepID=A0A2I1HQA2_9GLOM|nr:hypothetical protein RhiirA4_550826 [Rhizophagus irregularis]